MAAGFTPVNEELEQQEKVYADLVKIYPDNESYLRKYAMILLEAGKPSTATNALKQLYDVLVKKAPDKASALAREFPQIGRITKSDEDRQDDAELGQALRESLGTLWLKLHQKRIKEGRKLYSIGDKGDSLALVLDGEMAVCIPGENSTILLNLIGKNDIIGEACYLNPGERSADVVANKDCTIVEIPRKKLLSYFIENPGAEKLLQDKADFRQMTSILSTNSLLQNIPLDMRKYMAGTADSERYQPNTVVRQAGQEIDAVDMLVWGKASYMMQNKKGQYVQLGTFQVGELIGDTSAIRKATCPADIVANTEVLMAHIPLSSFTNVVEAYPPFKEKLMKHAERQRTKMMQMVANLGSSGEFKAD